MTEDLRSHVAKHLSPIAKPDEISYFDSLPKTRSGKIMRRGCAPAPLAKTRATCQRLKAKTCRFRAVVAG